MAEELVSQNDPEVNRLSVDSARAGIITGFLDPDEILESMGPEIDRVQSDVCRCSYGGDISDADKEHPAIQAADIPFLSGRSSW